MDEWGLFVIGYLPYFSFSSHHGLEKITSRICCDGVLPKQQVFVIATRTVFFCEGLVLRATTLFMIQKIFGCGLSSWKRFAARLKQKTWTT